MIATRATVLALSLSLATAGAGAAVAAQPAADGHPVHGVAGKVSGTAAPLDDARVYLYRLSDLSLEKGLTDERGHFLFEELPAGLYKVIAHKAGFVPAVVQLTRATADAYQFLELELAEKGDETTGEDFWALRSQVPADVLRDIQVAELRESTRSVFAGPAVGSFQLATEMRAMTGVEDVGAGSEGQMTRGGVGIQGRLGGVRLGLSGDYWQLQPALGGGSTAGPSAQAQELSLSVSSDHDTRVQLTSRNDRLTLDQRAPVDFEHYRLAVSSNVGERGRSDFVAQYTAESNLHRHGWMEPATIPEASRSWRLEGTYTQELSERSRLRTGVRYREREQAFTLADPALAPQNQRVDLFGLAGMEVQPSVLVEYGLYTTLQDGSMSLSPRGGVVVQLASDWQASAAASYKMYEDEPLDRRAFTPSLAYRAASGDACEQNQDHCYQVALVHQKSEDEVISVGASHRRFDETRRVYFSDDLLDRFESLYLVPGDEVPEVNVAVSRRITPQVLARLESNLAQGGGGVFYATGEEAYENRVRYLVTSLDTHFDGTATGLFVAFHHLQQQLELPGSGQQRGPQLEVERLELMLTQDLNILVDMATDMALHLNMQLSRGSLPFLSDAASHEQRDELRKSLLGGIALRF